MKRRSIQNIQIPERLHSTTTEHFLTLSQSSAVREFVQINDGTLRVTVKWKPDNYHSLTKNEDEWNEQAVEMLNDILQLPTPIIQLT
jgi:hypothetical protein